MANSFFKFKKFTVWHDKCAMKVGTDGVLLGAWTNINQSKTILDIGTGTGLIALMLAQRSMATIDAIDIDKEACLQAKENIALSPFNHRINIYNQPFNDFATNSNILYDLIVSNPPYFSNSLKCPEKKRNMARHNDSLLLTDLLNNSAKIVSPHGRIAIILPAEQEIELTNLCKTFSLYIIRKTYVLPIPNANPKRILVELSKDLPLQKNTSSLTIEISRHQYTTEFCALTKEFYLKM
jgi:tRNA1Val (adenine37-N6)-methyltransferase